MSAFQKICSWLLSVWAYFLQLVFGAAAGGGVSFQKSGIIVELAAASKSGSLGEGAFSTVYRATDRSDRTKSWAVKKMFIQSPEFERALYQEIDSFQRFRHANILKLVDSQVEIKDGVKIAYLLFPLMKRGSLRDELNRTILGGGTTERGGSGRLLQVLNDFSAIASAFNVLHSHSPAHVHQDVKPENILIADDGKPLLTDFGSVRLAEINVTNRAQALAVVDEAASFCTVSYRAPELFDPPKGSKLDTRTDVWGMGCLLFAWWFGLSPFECEFTEAGGVRVTDCSHSRVLSKMPRPTKPSREDSVVLELCEWILEKNPAVRVFTSDVLVRLKDVIISIADKDLRQGPNRV